MDQEDRYTSYTDEKAIIKTPSKKKMDAAAPKLQPVRQPPQNEQTRAVILFRLRTGHNRLNADMYSKFKTGESEMCPCNPDFMTAEHLLQHCQQHDALTRDMWPEPVPLRVKLCGNLEELRRTATFVRATAISV